MSELETLSERVRAVERAVVGEGSGDRDGDDATDERLAELSETAEVERELERLGDRLDALDGRIAELEAALQAVRGYVGRVRSVNEDVARRADAALAKAEALEADRRGGGQADGSGGVAASESESAEPSESDAEPPTDPGTTAMFDEIRDVL